jgi:hypothetical protein
MQSLLGCALLFPGVDCNFFYSVGPPCIFTHRLMKLQVLWTIPVQKKVRMTLQSFIFPIPWFFLSYKTGPHISEWSSPEKGKKNLKKKVARVDVLTWRDSTNFTPTVMSLSSSSQADIFSLCIHFSVAIFLTISSQRRKSSNLITEIQEIIRDEKIIVGWPWMQTGKCYF